MKSSDGCNTWGFGWQQLCEFLDIRFPEKAVW
jgi:hypothetical protein